MKKIRFYFVITILSFIFSCTSTKKIQQDDEFATESTDSNSQNASTQEISEFDLDQTTENSQSASDSNQTPKDEFADFSDPAAQPNEAPVESSPQAEKKDEFAEFEQNQKPAEEQAQAPDSSPSPEISAQQPIESVPQQDNSINTAANPLPEVSQEPLVEKPNLISAVSYKSNQAGGAVSIQGEKPIQFTTRLNSATNQLVVELQNSVVPAKLKRSLNTKDMASSIGSVDIYQKPNSRIARFVIQLRPGSTEPLVQPEGNSILIIGTVNEEYIAKQKAESEKINSNQSQSHDGFTDLSSEGVMNSQSLEEFLAGNNKFYGKKISIETNNLDVKEAIKFIAEESGANLLMDEGLDGKISLKLKQVPWDQALILILKAKKLGYVRQGNVLRIAKLTDLQNEEIEAFKLLENRRSNEPLVVKRFFISYAKISDIEEKIRAFIEATASVNSESAIGASQIGGPGQNASSSSAQANNSSPKSTPKNPNKGRVISDERTGSLIVTDTPDNIQKIEKLIAALDTQPKQIMVEQRIISANENFARGLGINWGTSGSTTSANSVKGLIQNGVGNNTFNGTFTWGNLDTIGNLDATLQLGESQKKVRTLQTGRTITNSGGIALIKAQSTLNIPITTTNTASNVPIGTSGFTTISYGLTGEITPQASNENTISADVKVVNERLVDNKTGDKITDTLGGKIIARNGQTVVVSANFSSSSGVTDTGVPGLKDIPVFGALFRGKTETNDKTEILMFATMNILEPVSGILKKANIDLNPNIEIK